MRSWHGADLMVKELNHRLILKLGETCEWVGNRIVTNVIMENGGASSGVIRSSFIRILVQRSDSSDSISHICRSNGEGQ